MYTQLISDTVAVTATARRARRNDHGTHYSSEKQNCFLQQSVIVHVCDPSTEELRQEDFECELKLAYIVKCCLKSRQTDRQTQNCFLGYI